MVPLRNEGGSSHGMKPWFMTHNYSEGLFRILVFPDRRVVTFYVGIRVCDASTPRPHPVSR